MDRGPYFVKAESITDGGRIDFAKLAHIDDSTHAGLARSVLEPNDILFTIAGTIGRTALVTPDLIPANANQAVAIIRPDPDKVLPRFLYYALRDRIRVRHAITRVVQSVQANLSLQELSQIAIPLAPLSAQQAVADTLGVLDDKIDLNRKTSATLEELMHATYASRWRTNDRSIALADIVEFHRDPVNPRQVGPDTVYVGLEHMTPRSVNLEKHGRAMDVGSGKAAFQPGDVLFGRLRPYFHKVAVAHVVGIASQEILVLRPRSPDLLGLAICEASHPALIDHATAVSTGTRMPRASWVDIARFRFGYRGSPAEITEFVSPLLNLMQSYIRQNETLAQLGDLLLPKLMSGEIRVKEAEKAVAEAL